MGTYTKPTSRAVSLRVAWLPVMHLAGAVIRPEVSALASTRWVECRHGTPWRWSKVVAGCLDPWAEWGALCTYIDRGRKTTTEPH